MSYRLRRFNQNPYSVKDPAISPIPRGLEEVRVTGGGRGLGKGHFPEGLKIIRFAYYWGTFEPGMFPSTLEELYFHSGPDKPIPEGVLPNGLRVLQVGYELKQDGCFISMPPALEELIVQHFFCRPNFFTHYLDYYRLPFDIRNPEKISKNFKRLIEGTLGCDGDGVYYTQIVTREALEEEQKCTGMEWYLGFP
jgi:FNIP Repeat